MLNSETGSRIKEKETSRLVSKDLLSINCMCITLGKKNEVS